MTNIRKGRARSIARLDARLADLRANLARRVQPIARTKIAAAIERLEVERLAVERPWWLTA